jgi:hypothetical protein
MLRDLLTQKCSQNKIGTDFGYPRACRLKKYQKFNRSSWVAVIRPKTEDCLRTKNEDCNKTKTSTGIGPKKMRGAVTRPKNITDTGIGPKKNSNKTKKYYRYWNKTKKYYRY